MEDYSYIIDKVVKTPKTRELVRKTIPILVSWAINEETSKTYRDMTHALGYSVFSGIAGVLGRVDDVIKELGRVSGKEIPSLNSFCKNAHTKLPSDGFSYVYPNYSSLNINEKQKMVAGIDQTATNYKEWYWVLNALGLKPAPVLSEEEWKKLRQPVYGSGGEGKEHKTLKEFIKSHPGRIGIKDVEVAETEHILPSGDRLDVLFILKNGTHIAVEIKPSTSPENDVARGIFQCIKYEATMKAERKLLQQSYDIQTLLVIGADMCAINKKIANELKVRYIVISDQKN